MIEKLYTVEEVAELASVTGRTIRNYLKSGRLVGRKIGGQWRFPESEVQRLLSGGEAPVAIPAPTATQPNETLQPSYQQPVVAQATSTPKAALAAPAAPVSPVIPAEPEYTPPSKPHAPVEPSPEPAAEPFYETPEPAFAPPAAYYPEPVQPAEPPASKQIYQPYGTPAPLPVQNAPVTPVLKAATHEATIGRTSQQPTAVPFSAAPPAAPTPAKPAQPAPQPASPAPTSNVSDIGQKVVQFVEQVHDCSRGAQACTVVETVHSLQTAREAIAHLRALAEQESAYGIACSCYVEYDERYYIARYTLLGSTAFMAQALQIID